MGSVPIRRWVFVGVSGRTSCSLGTHFLWRAFFTDLSQARKRSSPKLLWSFHWSQGSVDTTSQALSRAIDLSCLWDQENMQGPWSLLCFRLEELTEQKKGIIVSHHPLKQRNEPLPYLCLLGFAHSHSLEYRLAWPCPSLWLMRTDPCTEKLQPHTPLWELSFYFVRRPCRNSGEGTDIVLVQSLCQGREKVLCVPSIPCCLATLNADHQCSSSPLTQGKWLSWRRCLSQREGQDKQARLELCYSGLYPSPTI